MLLPKESINLMKLLRQKVGSVYSDEAFERKIKVSDALRHKGDKEPMKGHWRPGRKRLKTVCSKRSSFKHSNLKTDTTGDNLYYLLFAQSFWFYYCQFYPCRSDLAAKSVLLSNSFSQADKEETWTGKKKKGWRSLWLSLFLCVHLISSSFLQDLGKLDNGNLGLT